MTWSRIQHTELATEAYIQMNENEIAGCKYHNNDHIESMYQYLEDTNEPYNEALDWAIMFHDIVYDDQPRKELRSVDLFLSMMQKHRGFDVERVDVLLVNALIMSTVEHLCVKDHYSNFTSAMIRADLHALTKPLETIKNFTKIAEESMILYGCDLKTFAENSEMFMTSLRDRMEFNKKVDIEHKEFYNDIISGINTTITLARLVRGL